MRSQLQYDYLACYLAFFSEAPEQARAIAERYQDYPVDRWRERFRTVLAHLDEARGAPAEAAPSESREETQAARARAEPHFEFGVEGHHLWLRAENLSEFTLSAYCMDVELLFSRQPFNQQESEHFAFVRPNHQETLRLPPGGGRLDMPLPEPLRSQNLLLEITGAGKRQSLTHFRHSLQVSLQERQGQLRVADAQGRPLPRTYVKVYARIGGAARFYKDGHSDLRGRFHYASVSSPDQGLAERFALLILHPEHGATIREVRPPAR